MPRVLHLFNVLGALTERAMLDYTLGLAKRVSHLTVGYEQLDENAPTVPFELVKLARVNVEPTDDVAAQMNELAERVDDPARRQLLGQPFDLVHGHFGPRILQGAAWLVRGTPMVVSCYGYDVARLLRDPCWIERYRWAADHGATFVALADAMRRKLTDLGIPEPKLELIRLGIDVAAHRYDPRPAPSHPRFVFVGRFVEKKGADVLVKAMGQLVHEMKTTAQLDLIGAGPMEQSLRQLASELELAEHVRFVGLVPFGELFGWLRGATALVQPSVTASDGDAEGAPMVLMHAQSLGVPCITTNHSGNPEVLPPSARRLAVPERDARALAAAMGAIIGLSAARRKELQEQSRQWIEREYDLQKTIELYSELYHRAAEGAAWPASAVAREAAPARPRKPRRST